MSSNSKRLVIAFVLFLAWCLILMRSGSVNRGGKLLPPTLEAPLVTPVTDFNWNLQDLDGTPVNFAEFKGRPILLNMWATWCPPCREEMPSLAKLAENSRIVDNGIIIMAVSVDDSPDALKGFVKANPSRIVMLRADRIPAAFRTETIPTTYLIAPDGRIVTSENGPAQWDDPSVVDYLVKLSGK